jgi:FKBP-type peptidyl-prolyl cis-trans isomerase
VNYLFKTIGVTAALFIISLAIVACGPATPPAEEVDESAEANSESGALDSDEASSSEVSSSESITGDEAEESGEALGESEPPSLEGSFDIYGGADAGDFTETDSGLQYIIIEEGNGPVPEFGEMVSVHYSGYLTNGTPFDSSRDGDQPYGFPLGQGRVGLRSKWA